MCLGIPMQVTGQAAPGRVMCAHGGETVEIDTLLVGEVAVGTWLMTFLGAAREVMDPQSAQRTLDALSALEAAMIGQRILDDPFADLVGAGSRHLFSLPEDQSAQ
ncbi:MAG: HypC/HybG/HupF family hydrogenase formation chaperone [Pseudomonadota bacterium]